MEVEPVTTDRYGRTVAFVRVGNTLVNEELIRRGLAKPARVVGKEEIVDEPLDPDPARERRGVELAASVRPLARSRFFLRPRLRAHVVHYSSTAAETTVVQTPPEAPSAVCVMLVLSTMCPPMRYCSRRSL